MRNYRIIKNIKNERYYIQYQKKLFFTNRWFYLRENHRDKNFNIFQYELFYILSPLILCSFLLIIPAFIFFVEMIYPKESFYKDFQALNKIKDLEQKQWEDNQIKKYGKEKIVGIYLNGEYIDGVRLERMKKLEKIVND